MKKYETPEIEVIKFLGREILVDLSDFLPEEDEGPLA